MATPPQAGDEIGPLGCLYAVAIGLLTVVGTAVTFSLLTGRPLRLSEEWSVFLFQMLIVAVPFGVLAILRVGRKLPWLVGLALTFALWGYILFDGVRYQWHPDGTGANIGLGLILLASPFFITAACLGVHAWQRRPARGEQVHAIGPETIARLPLAGIESVTFDKLDELTSDLIRCSIKVGDKVWVFHEELEGWDLLLRHIQELPDFRADWFKAVSQLPFAASETVAFERRKGSPGLRAWVPIPVAS